MFYSRLHRVLSVPSLSITVLGGRSSAVGGPWVSSRVAGEIGVGASPPSSPQPKLRGLGGEHSWKNLGRGSQNHLSGLWAKMASVAPAGTLFPGSRDQGRGSPLRLLGCLPFSPSPPSLPKAVTRSPLLRNRFVWPFTLPALEGSSFLGRTRNLILSGIVPNPGEVPSRSREVGPPFSVPASPVAIL